MKFTSVFCYLGLVVTSLAHPTSEKRQNADPADHVTVANLTFHGGPVSYSMTVPADGQVYQTNNDISVNIIDTPTYNAYSQCTFHTPGEKTLVQSLGPDNKQQIIVGPPQPITAVSCEGYCISTYSRCYGYYGDDDQYYGPLGPCCNGYCAANLCRPWF